MAEHAHNTAAVTVASNVIPFPIRPTPVPAAPLPPADEFAARLEALGDQWVARRARRLAEGLI